MDMKKLALLLVPGMVLVLLLGLTAVPAAANGPQVSGVCPPRTLYSGVSTSGIPGDVSGFVPRDEFMPGEEVWVYGEGFYAPVPLYQMYILPYEECTYVTEGAPLIPGLCPPGFAPTGVMANPDGTLGPLPLWTVPEGEVLDCFYWEIVADSLIAPGIGVYNCEWDGLDAIACDEWGLRIYPEALTVTLLSVGLVGLGGYYVIRRRRQSRIDE